MNIKPRYLLNGSALVALAMSGSMALAQNTSTSAKRAPNGVETGDIIVTAQKRSESAQKVPIALTAVSGLTLERTQISNLEGLQNTVPSLSIGQTTGVARIALRGVGIDNLGLAAEGSIALHVDGVFIARSAAALAGFYDVERVEVLRGPQGTLYGRNTTGGAINVITRRPTAHPEGYVNFTYANYNAVKVEGAISGPLIEDKILARFAFSTDNHEGWGKNIFTGTDIDDANRKSFRGTLEFHPRDDVKLSLTADYHRENDHNYAYHYFGTVATTAGGQPTIPTGVLLGGITAPNRKDVAHDTDDRNLRTFWGVSGDLNWDLGFAKFYSQTAYRDSEYLTETDLDQTTAAVFSPFTQTERAKQLTQEFRLTGGRNRLNWLFGLYYFRESDTALSAGPLNSFVWSGGRFPFPGTLVQGSDARGTLVTKATAAFGQIDYKITPELQLSLGARYSREKKAVSNRGQFDLTRPYSPTNPFLPTRFQDTNTTFGAFTYRVSIDYNIRPTVLAYASYSTGFKSGTYKVGFPQPLPVSPEKITAYEAGLKSTLAGGLLRLNAAAFYYDYTNLQVSKIVGTVQTLENAANARIYGVEVESRLRPTPNLEFNLSGSWLHARFVNYISSDPARPQGDGVTTINGQPAFNLAGKTLAQAPKFTLTGGAEYRIEMKDYLVTLRGEVGWIDRVFFTAFNRPQVGSEPKTKVNAFVTLEPTNGPWSLGFFAKNIGGKRYIQNAYVNSAQFGFTYTGGLEEPRTYGVTARMKF